MAVVDRALNETAIKIIWLCQSRLPDRFRRFMANGLRNDLEFERHIKQAIVDGGHSLVIEQRMLRSIQSTVSSARMSKRSIKTTKRMPDMASMMSQIGMSGLSYLVVQRMGSHCVHGTWSALLMHSLEKGADGKPTLKGQFNRAHVNELMFGSKLVLYAIRAFATFAILRPHRTSVLNAIDKFIGDLEYQNEVMASPGFSLASK